MTVNDNRAPCVVAGISRVLATSAAFTKHYQIKTEIKPPMDV